jgi:hypothetical protein
MLSKGGTQSEPVVRTVGHSARTSRQEARAEIAAVRAASGAVPVRASYVPGGGDGDGRARRTHDPVYPVVCGAQSRRSWSRRVAS